MRNGGVHHIVNMYYHHLCALACAYELETLLFFISKLILYKMYSRIRCFFAYLQHVVIVISYAFLFKCQNELIYLMEHTAC